MPGLEAGAGAAQGSAPAPCEGFHRGSPCQGCEPSAFLRDLISKGKTDERREKQLFGNEL